MPTLIVNDALCVGHGRCYVNAPELLECDDDGFVIPRDETIVVSAEQAALAGRAAASCPEGAITYAE